MSLMSLSGQLVRTLRQRRAANRSVLPDDCLAPVDQGSFLMSRASGRAQIMQCVWTYEHPVDLDALRRFQHFLAQGLVGRRIERSALPFGRHRWVSGPVAPSELDIAETRPRSGLSDWLDERTQIPIDPEFGPGWHLGVLPMDDGSTAISLVGSHCLLDGVGGVLAIIEAIKGETRTLGYRRPRTRTRRQAFVADTRQTVRDMPVVGRTLVAAAKLAYRKRHDFLSSAKPAAGIASVPAADDTAVVMPAITVYVDTEDWDARALALGGTSYALLAGVGAKLGERMGRRHTDDSGVTLLIAISDRTLDDTRAHAMEFANVNVDSARVCSDLTDARAVIRQAIKKLREEPDEAFQMLPLVPFVPKRAVQMMGDVVFGFDDLPVACSNLGDIDPTLGRLDGTDAEYVALRGVDQNVTRRYIERAGGHLALVSARINGRISIGIVGYRVGAENSKARLRELAADTLAEFDLTGVID
jgi:hypothetical protein